MSINGDITIAIVELYKKYFHESVGSLEYRLIVESGNVDQGRCPQYQYHGE